MKLCCICDNDFDEYEEGAELVYMRYNELCAYPVCSPSCAEILINRKEKQREEAQRLGASSSPKKPRGDRHAT